MTYLLLLALEPVSQKLLVFSSLGGVQGIPKVHFKGRQAEYYIMVRVLTLCMSVVLTTYLVTSCGLTLTWMHSGHGHSGA